MRGKRLKYGFTIVELVVVIAVIGILAAMTVVGYGQWRDQVERGAVQSDLKQMAAAMESARNFTKNYPAMVPDSFTPSQGVELSYESGDGSAYCVNAHSKARTDIQYYIDTTVSKEPQEGQCTP